MKIARTVPLAALTMGLIAGCADDPAPATSAPATNAPAPAPISTTAPPDSAARRTTSGGEGGITAAEAKSRGVFTAEYDAGLRAPDTAHGESTSVLLLNVGTKADRYRITVEPASAGSVTPSTAKLKSGAQLKMDLKLKDDVWIRVFSVGRNAEVAALPVKKG